MRFTVAVSLVFITSAPRLVTLHRLPCNRRRRELPYRYDYGGVDVREVDPLSRTEGESNRHLRHSLCLNVIPLHAVYLVSRGITLDKEVLMKIPTVSSESVFQKAQTSHRLVMKRLRQYIMNSI